MFVLVIALLSFGISRPLRTLDLHERPATKVHASKVHASKVHHLQPNEDPFDTTEGEIELEDETYEGKSITLTGSLDISGDGEEEITTFITVNKGVKYTVGQNALSISGIKFNPVQSGFNSLDAPLIDSTQGSLILRMVTFEGITLASDPLLAVGNKGLPAKDEWSSDLKAIDFDEVVFKDIERTASGKGGGSVLEITGIEEEIEIIYATFDNCRAPGGLGGAIYCSVSSLSHSENTKEPNIPLYFAMLTFKNVPSNAAKTGLCIYVDFGDLNKADFVNAYMNFLYMTPHAANYHMFVAKDVTTATNLYTLVDPVLLVIDHTSASSGSDNTANCGTFTSPCRTLAVATQSNKYTAEDSQLFALMFTTGTHLAETATSTISRELYLASSGSDPSETVITVATIGSNDAVITVAADDNSGNTRLSVSTMTFKATSASSTGVFKLTASGSSGNVPTLSLNEVKFINAAETVSYSKPIVDATAGYLRVDDCLFSTLTLTNCPLFKISTEEDRFSLEYTTFTKITRSTGNGVILEETITASTNLQIGYDNEFASSCSSASGVGLFFFTLSSTEGKIRFDASLTYDTDGCHSDAAHGLFGFKANSITEITTWSNFQSCRYGECSEVNWNQEQRYYGVLTTPAVTAQIAHLSGKPPSYMPVFIGTSDVANGLEQICGWSDIPCGKFAENVKTTGTFYLVPGTHTSKAITLSGSLTLSGVTQACTDKDEGSMPSTSLTVTKGIKFTTGTHQLQLSNIIICPPSSGFVDLEDYLFDATEGTLAFYTVYIQDIKLKGCCLINANPGSTFSSGADVVFKSISRTDTGEAGQPAASVLIFNPIPDGGSLNIEGLSFESCSGAANGLGGAVYIKIAGALTGLSFSSRPFSGTVSQPSKGKYMYLDVSAIDGFEEDEDTLDALRDLVSDTQTDTITLKLSTGEKDLFDLLGITQLALSVEKDATDSCTAAKKKCATLTAAVELIEKQGVTSGNTITIASGVELNADGAQFTTSKGLSITGASGKTKVTVTHELSDTLFAFDDSLGAIVCSLQSLNIVVSATKDNALTKNLIEIEDYVDLTLTDISFASAESGKPCYTQLPLIYAEEGKLTLAGVSFSDFTLVPSNDEEKTRRNEQGCQSLLYVDTHKGYFTISSTTTFTNIVKEEGDGAVLNCELDEELVLQNAEFTSCKALKGSGGAVYVEAGDGTTFTVKNCKFTSCEAGTVTKAASNAVSRGGAMYLELEGEPTVTLASVTTKDCKATGENGGNVLYCHYEVETGQTVPDSFWKSLMSGVSGATAEDYVAVTVSEGRTSDPIDLKEAAGSETNAPTDDDDGFPTWAIILIVVLVVVIIAVVVIVVVLLLLRRKSSEGSSSNEDKEADTPQE